MGKGASILLAVLFAAHSFYSATLFIGFQLNRETVTRLFCVNTARPEMKCGGSCYLAKQLKKAEEENHPQQLKEWIQTAPFLPSEIGTLNPPSQPLAVHAEKPQGTYAHDPCGSVFHPPLS